MTDSISNVTNGPPQRPAFTDSDPRASGSGVLEAIVEASPALISYIDRDLRYRFVNRQYEVWFGRRREDVVGRPMGEVLGEDALARLQPHLDAVLRGEEVRFEAEVPYREGGTRVIHAHYAPDVEAQGRVVGIYVLVVDRTEQRRAEQALEEAARRERSIRLEAERQRVLVEGIVGSAPLAIAVLRGPDLEFVSVNPAYQAIAAPGTTILSRTFGEVFPEAAERGAGTALREVLSTGRPWKVRDFETEIPGREGPTWWEGECIALPDEGGAGSVLVLIWEITERKHAEMTAQETARRLERALAELQATYDDVPLGLLQVDRDLRYIRINEALAAMNGVPVSEHLGRTVREIVPDLAPKIEPAFRQVMESGEPVVDVEVEGETAADPGVVHTWLESWFPMRDSAGNVTGLNVVAQDITERKRTEAALREALSAAEHASRAKSDFLSIMSHELRTPLNAIAGYVQLLDMGIHGPLTPSQKAVLERVARSGRHLLRLINDILNLARVESGRIDYDLADVSITEALAGITPMIEPQLAQRNLAYEVATAPDLVVRADREKVEQILLNLLGNAAKFTPEGGRITVHADENGGSGDALFVHIADTGPGIPPDKLESIFDPFVQVDTSLTGSRGGVGLGLAISRRLARGMGGDLTVESALGSGSTFTLSLPAAKPGPR